MTEAMPFLRKPILLSYDPRPCERGFFHFRVAVKNSDWELFLSCVELNFFMLGLDKCSE
jgi:hypothetical protein